MLVSLACLDDVESILAIVAQQRTYLSSHNIPQWQSDYPSRETFLEDIKLHRLYCLRQDREVIGFFALVYPDPCYEHIEGKWKDNSSYQAIHRLAIKDQYKGCGYANQTLDFLKNQYNHLRLDTHELNKVMNACALANGFTYQGVVYMEDGSPRNAYEWTKQ